MFSNWKKSVFFAFIVMVIVAVVLYQHYKHQSAPFKAFTPAPVNVILTQVTQERWPTLLQGSGFVSAEQGVMIRAQVAGQIVSQFAHSSTAVREGQALYQIDPQGLAQLIKQNEAQVALMKSELAEQAALVKKRYVSKDDYDKAIARYKVALNTLKQNQRKLELTVVTAPFDGKLGVMLVHKGDVVKANQPLVSLQDSNSLRVDFTVPGNFANQAQLGQKIEFEVLEYPGSIFAGKVISVNSSVNQASQSILIRAHVDERLGQRITPGSFASVALYLNENHLVLTVPETAIVYNDSGTYVYKVTKGTAHLTQVKLGQRVGDRIAVSSGLNADDEVVAEGKEKLMDGVRVQQA